MRRRSSGFLERGDVWRADGAVNTPVRDKIGDRGVYSDIYARLKEFTRCCLMALFLGENTTSNAVPSLVVDVSPVKPFPSCLESLLASS